MPDELDLMRARMNRLERQLRVLKIAAAVLAGLALVMSLAPGSAAQQTGATMRLRQLVIEDVEGRSRLVLGPLDAPGNNRRIGLRVNDPNGAERFGVSYMKAWLSFTDFTQTPPFIRRYGLGGDEVLRPPAQ